MTIPTLHQSITEKVTVVKLKKTFSTLQSAYTFAVQENGSPDNWNIVGDQYNKSRVIFSQLEPYLRILKKCDNPTDCMKENYKTLAFNSFQSINSNMYSFILSDGTAIAMWTTHTNCSPNNLCGEFFVDTNGTNPPNQYGKDFFGFLLIKDKGFLPVGIEGQVYSFDTFCNRTINKAHETGRGCAAWVVYNENMDYLHCDDLKWNGKKKCD